MLGLPERVDARKSYARIGEDPHFQRGVLFPPSSLSPAFCPGPRFSVQPLCSLGAAGELLP